MHSGPLASSSQKPADQSGPWNAPFRAEHAQRRPPHLGPRAEPGQRRALAPKRKEALYYTILYYTILYYTILYYTILYYTILYYTILYYNTILYYTILYYTILYYTILYYTVI